MSLDLFNDVFLLHLAFEAPQCILEGFALLQSNFRQRTTPPNRSDMDYSSFTRFKGQVKQSLAYPPISQAATLAHIPQSNP